MIELQQLTKRHRAGDIETTALDAIDLHIEAGEYVAITGPSGCGKSTLLGLLGLLDRPTSGRYRLQGEDVTDRPERALAAIRRGRIGFVFQSFNLVDEMNVEENVRLALRYGGQPEKAQRARVAEVLERLGLAHRARHHPSQLADEPTGNLDSAHGQEVMRLLRELNDEGTTLVMVTHSAEHAALASRTVRLLDGRVLVDAQAEHLS